MVDPFRTKSALEVLMEGEAEAQKGLMDATADLVGLMVVRMKALEDRVYKLEDVVREILQRTAGIGRVVQATERQADSEQLPSDHNGQGGAEPSGDGVSVPPSSGEAVK